MSFASPFVAALHLLYSLPLLNLCEGSLPSLEMKNLLFIERRSHSAFDLVLEFFNRTLLPSCDFTANLCDVNCCNDKDCNDEHVDAFSCRKHPEPFTVDPILSDSMYCYCNGTSTFFDPVLCYETENSPFLGLYFMEDKILKRKSVENNLENISPSRYFAPFKPVKPVREKYTYGEPLRYTGKGNLVTLPVEILGKGYCDYHSTMRFLVDSGSVCTSEINPVECVGNSKFQLETYLEESRNEMKHPEIFSGTEAPIVANITVQCGQDIFEIEDFSAVNEVLEACGNATKLRRTEFDATRQVCENVVTQVEYHFTWHGNALVALDVIVGLSEISTVPPKSHVPSRRGRSPRVTQIFTTTFHQNENNSRRREHGSYHDNDEILLHHV